jgi:hypothetical protein
MFESLCGRQNFVEGQLAPKLFVWIPEKVSRGRRLANDANQEWPAVIPARFITSLST